MKPLRQLENSVHRPHKNSNRREQESYRHQQIHLSPRGQALLTTQKQPKQPRTPNPLMSNLTRQFPLSHPYTPPHKIRTKSQQQRQARNLQTEPRNREMDADILDRLIVSDLYYCAAASLHEEREEV